MDTQLIFTQKALEEILCFTKTARWVTIMVVGQL